MSEYASLKVTDLRDLCRNRKLRVSGVKDELISRLQQADMEQSNNSNSSSIEQKEFEFRSRKVDRGAGGDEGSKAIGGLPHSESEFELWQRAKEQEKSEREALVLWRKPLVTIYYFLLESKFLFVNLLRKIWQNFFTTLAVLLVVGLLAAARSVQGPHQQLWQRTESTVLWCSWWIWLGILSSVGLGTGLHTFLIYLGPHIAKVTLAASDCGSLNFPEPPYPQQIVCPDLTQQQQLQPSLWDILAKVRLEAFCWGAGTAIGELPPYFLSRTARLSGMDPDDEDFDEFEQLLHSDADEMSFGQKAKLFVHRIVQNLGFWGILLCASIPNPLFDLAGITCGHFLIPFRTFFTATLIGKAVAKMHLQTVFVIFAFSPNLVHYATDLLSQLPRVGPTAQKLINDLLTKQRNSLHRGDAGAASAAAAGKQNLLQQAFELLVVSMVLYFVVSIVNSFAQSYYKRVYHRDRAVQHFVSKSK